MHHIIFLVTNLLSLANSNDDSAMKGFLTDEIFWKIMNWKLSQNDFGNISNLKLVIFPNLTLSGLGRGLQTFPIWNWKYFQIWNWKHFQNSKLGIPNFNWISKKQIGIPNFELEFPNKIGIPNLKLHFQKKIGRPNRKLEFQYSIWKDRSLGHKHFSHEMEFQQLDHFSSAVLNSISVIKALKLNSNMIFQIVN